ncbi:mitochondrial import inner membrane translocase subunit tim21 [Sporothrix eucalyptigena]|uniref:Mitochondrial import inner membrane translocase subunit Tim21 n=1 Tax=Sporothrix eucalyptigena TaxID=1812306 RepID=A0ABP0CE54_9PEZI
MRPPQVCSLASQASTAAARSTAAAASRTSCRMTASFPARVASKAPLTPALARAYATQHQNQSSSSSSSSSSSTTSRRRSVTPFNDDGHVPWTELSGGEKTARAAQQTFNLGMVIVGVVLTGGVCYFLFTEVFSPNSKVSNFNRAVDRIKADHRITDILGDSRQIIAHGEETANKWRRARPIASTERTDTQGNDHLVMNFHIEGPRAQGTANLHLIRRRGQSEFSYQYFYVDVPGHERIYLEKSGVDAPGDKRGTLFGIKWS